MEFKEVTSNEVQTEKDVLVASCGINEEHPEEPKAQILDIQFDSALQSTI